MWSPIEDLLTEAKTNKLFSGCALSIRTLDEELFVTSTGLSELRPNRRIATSDTIWDLASLTKVLCTSHLLLRWAASGKIHVNMPISDVLPEVPKEITIADCLSHSSGYGAWRPFYASHTRKLERWKKGDCRDEILQTVIKSRPESMPMIQHKYSDIGFLILCAFIERMSGLRIDKVWRRDLPVTATRGLYWGNAQAAATEDCPVRNRVVVGEVHDLNAAAMGGVSTHAGLFGSVRSVANAAIWPLRAWYNQDPTIPKTLVEEFWTYRGAGTHCLGWDTPSPLHSSASELWPKDGIGHLGFTGCSFWLSPSLKLAVCFLSNRVHPIVEGGSIPNAPQHPRLKAFKQMRQELHRRIITIFKRL